VGDRRAGEVNPLPSASWADTMGSAGRGGARSRRATGRRCGAPARGRLLRQQLLGPTPDHEGAPPPSTMISSTSGRRGAAEEPEPFCSLVGLQAPQGPAQDPGGGPGGAAGRDRRLVGTRAAGSSPVQRRAAATTSAAGGGRTRSAPDGLGPAQSAARRAARTGEGEASPTRTPGGPLHQGVVATAGAGIEHHHLGQGAGGAATSATK